jgi:hypothetical protein
MGNNSSSIASSGKSTDFESSKFLQATAAAIAKALVLGAAVAEVSKLNREFTFFLIITLHRLPLQLHELHSM